MAKKSSSFKQSVDLVRCASSTGDPHKEVMLTPWGSFNTHKGKMVVDEESAGAVLAAFAFENKDIPVDFEHTTVGGAYSTEDGSAPAAGWITKIYARPGEGLFALVKWNEKAEGMIKRDEYRWLSPVVMLRREDRKVMAVTSAALTNKPAIIDMERVAAKDDGERTMDLKALKVALSAAGVALPDDADDGAVLAAAEKHLLSLKATTDGATALAASVRAKLGVSKDATLEVVAAKIDEMRTETVPASEYKAVTSRLEQLELTAKTRESQELVACAIERAKLNPNHEPSMADARERAKCDPVAFKKWIEAAPELYTPGRIVTPDKKLDGTKGNREQVIASAREEYKENRYAGLTEEPSYVNDALRSANLKLLAKDELN